ncbi:MAG: hypothetical protein EZS28_037305, partial [Streblomastix strix]
DERDERGYIIWPPSDATPLPLVIQGDVQGNRVVFGMSDYTWLNARQRWYGILASNDGGKKFTGLDGVEDQPVKLNVVVEEGEQFVNFMRFQLAAWQAYLIPPVVVTFLTLFGAYLIFLYLKNKELKKQEENRIQILQQSKDVQVNLNNEERMRQQNANQEWLDHYEEGMEEVIENQNVPNPYKDYTIRDEMMTDHTPYRGNRQLSPSTVNINSSSLSSIQSIQSQSSSSSSYAQLRPQPRIVSYNPHAKFTGHLANNIPPPMDFSWLQQGSQELVGIDWGEAGPPPTLSLAYQGIFRLPEDVVEKQIQWEKTYKHKIPIPQHI